MKRVITLSIFYLIFLVSPLFGQEAGILYGYNTSAGIIWKTFGNAKVQPKYEGEISKGKMNGLGVLTYPYDGKSVVGEWKAGKEWNTEHRKPDGTLVGMLKKGKWILRWGDLYFRAGDGDWGWFVKGDENNDEKYVGEIKNGQPNGYGSSTFPNGTKYVGKFKNGKKHGQGALTMPDGREYVGKYKNGEPNGQGVLTYADGEKYVGEYKNGKTWNGTLYNNRGNIVGKYVNGEAL